jgi:hypothetical protein
LETPEQGSGRAGDGPTVSGAFPKSAETELAYPEKNRAWMRYADFRARRLFIGPGVIKVVCAIQSPSPKKIKKN